MTSCATRASTVLKAVPLSGKRVVRTLCEHPRLLIPQRSERDQLNQNKDLLVQPWISSTSSCTPSWLYRDKSPLRSQRDGTWYTHLPFSSCPSSHPAGSVSVERSLAGTRTSLDPASSPRSNTLISRRTPSHALDTFGLLDR